jgi:4-hydroxybenzoate polyprenyltransferase
MGIYFVYSMPPLRLKRVPILSKLLIAFNSLLLVMAGSMFISNGFKVKLPLSIIYPLFLIGLTFVLNFIDIKDYDGDKRAGILTLPVLLGLRTAKHITGFSFLLFYLSIYFIIPNLFIVPVLFLFGILQWFIICREPYNEKHIFYLYFISLIGMFFYLLFLYNP